MSELDEIYETAVQAADEAAQVILKNLGRLAPADVGTKQVADFVTRVDRESEDIIIETIKSNFPEHLIMSEESVREEQAGEYRWIIDPLDGTTNYIHRYPVFSVSIALEYRGEVVLGVILDPLRDEQFTARKGQGAFLNGSRIMASGNNSMENCLITTGFPFRKKEILDLYLRAFKKVFLRVSGIRRAGSAALDLAYLAEGRCDGFFELGLSAWDVAAGSIIVKEAGGVVTDFGGGDEYLGTGNVVAGNTSTHPEILMEIKEVFGGIIDK